MKDPLHIQAQHNNFLLKTCSTAIPGINETCATAVNGSEIVNFAETYVGSCASLTVFLEDRDMFA